MADRVPFKTLVDAGIIPADTVLVFSRDERRTAIVQADGTLVGSNGKRGTIHSLGARMTESSACNGWNSWYLKLPDGGYHCLKHVRAEQLRTLGTQLEQAAIAV